MSQQVPPLAEVLKPPEALSVDAIAIGRNEGERLVACLESLKTQVRCVVYVDSGSTDGSVAAAKALGAEVVELDMSRPFTAARARNAGLARAMALGAPDYVQLVDGDCALHHEWVGKAVQFLQARPQAALAFGRLRERFPDASVYNRLCDAEWNVPLGQAAASGGNVLVRTAALRAVGGFREDVIAAEDDELCQRLRAKGWTLWRIDEEMGWHDVAMKRFGQWWTRAVRAGHAFAQVGELHPGHFQAARKRAWIWGAGLPALVLASLIWLPPLALAPLLAYGLSFARVAWRYHRDGQGWRNAAGMAALITLSKWPNLQGLLTYHWRQWRRTGTQIIEYK